MLWQDFCRFRTLPDCFFTPFQKRFPVKHHNMIALKAAYFDVGSGTDHGPAVRSAGMGFTCLNNITDSDFIHIRYILPFNCVT